MNNAEQQFLKELDDKLWKAADQEEDSEPFADKRARLTTQLKTQFAESARL